ncbi:hypothetical protein JCM16303_005641 [Sporobolomyces ruberrimus]
MRKQRAIPLRLGTLSLLSLPLVSCSLQPRNLVSSTVSLATTNTTTTSNDSGGGGGGRYGHQSLYLSPPLNQLILLGGQLDPSSSNSSSQSPQLATTVLRFNVASTFLYGDDRPISSIPDNPSIDSSWTTTTTPSAFMAGAVVYDDRTVYLAGGIKPTIGGGSCSDDVSIVRSFNFSSSTPSTAGGGQTRREWVTPSFSPRLPPRRRQAQMIPVTNLTTLSTDLWVLGGIADEFTCSSDDTTVGYVGIDRYSTKLGQVESIAWTEPTNGRGGSQSGGWKGQPVSDYSAELLEDGTSIVVIGGQTSQGELVDLENVLVFNVESREWYSKVATGDLPSPRMGHISIPLSSGSILIHGGLSPSHTPLSDLQLLIPPPLSHLSQFSNSTTDPWVWKTLEISNDSMSSPRLAYHGASQIVGGTIVVSFGLGIESSDSRNGTVTEEGEEGELVASDQFWFLTIDEEAGTFTWKDTFDGNEAQVEAALQEEGGGGTETVQSRRLTKRLLVGELDPAEIKTMVKRVEVIANPKAYSLNNLHSSSSTTSSVASVETGWSGSGSGSNGNDGSGGTGQEVASPSSSSSSVKLDPPPSSSRIVVSSPSASSLASNVKQNSSSSNSTTIGASIGGTLGALALLSLAVILVRRRAASKRSQFMSPMTPDMSSNSTMDGPGGGAGGPPLVSSLMYTRPVQRRMLSLGSTISEMPSEHDTIQPGGGGGGTTTDPFSDDYNVNEHGLLGRSSSNASTARGAVVGTHGSLLARSKSSVTSIPFLSTINRDPASPAMSSTLRQDDVYTSRAPTLNSRRSLRRASQQLPSLPIPGTPAELIGLAVTSDDGHEAQMGLPYRSEVAGKGGEAWETFLQNQPTKPSSSSTVGGGEQGGIPAILRPATPLRVRNADPFADQ